MRAFIWPHRNSKPLSFPPGMTTRSSNERSRRRERLSLESEKINPLRRYVRMNKLRQFLLALFLFFLCANNSTTGARSPDELSLAPQSPVKQMEKERERAHAREQFTKNFRDL